MQEAKTKLHLRDASDNSQVSFYFGEDQKNSV
jgi:hypothetical protein